MRESFQANWLLSVMICAICMMMIGCYTRLSNSGLSIVEWKPVSGVLPPISESEWNIEFEKYQQFPEYKTINKGIELSQFKTIYYIEYVHRLIGRLLGILFAVPLLYFLQKDFVTKHQKIRYLQIFALILLQGVVGWYMVKSGLISHPHVSPFRLALHMMTACVIISLLFWQYLKTCQYYDLRHFDKKQYSNDAINSSSARKFRQYTKYIIMVIYLQIFLGALVAGLKAGMIYNSFPLMNGSFFPNERPGSILDIFTIPGIVQFIHRIVAYFLLVNIVFFCYRLVTFYRYDKTIVHSACILLFFIFLQSGLGIATLMFFVPIGFAMAHQLCGLLLLLSTIYILYNIENHKEIMHV